jgi:hypothetical protein
MYQRGSRRAVKIGCAMFRNVLDLPSDQALSQVAAIGPRNPLKAQALAAARPH